MTAVAELEARLHDDPDDRATWLVYADWLLGNGDPRGELVVADREASAGEREQFRGAIPHAMIAGWRHGFVIGLEAPLDHRLPALLAAPEARMIRSLALLPGSIEVLGDLAHVDLVALRSLAFRYAMLGTAGAEHLARCTTLANLRTLDLRYGRIGDAGLAALAAAPHLSALRALHLQRNELGELGCRALADSPHFTRLEFLDLRSNPIGAAGARALAGSPNTARLGRLRAHLDEITREGARLLAESPHLGMQARRYWNGITGGAPRSAREATALPLAGTDAGVVDDRPPQAPDPRRDDAAGDAARPRATAVDAKLDGWRDRAWATLSPADQLALGIALRDRFLALTAAQSDPVFHAIVDAIERDPDARVDGLGVSFHPTARHKLVRFVDADRLAPELRPRFARPSAATPQLAAVFVDPTELSYRTFENIIPLDTTLGPVGLALADPGILREGVLRLALDADPATRAALARLDELGLYVPPLDACSRGGLRFIFHAAGLADALTRAVRAALPAALLEGFSHVNPVFRCNRFDPGDRGFDTHLDTPYFDRARDHVSRYTLLVYLTGGRGEPALRIADHAITDIAPMTCFVFDQRLAHAGAAFADSRKVVLRTELIFGEKRFPDDPAIGAAFAKACYLTAQSVFAPELARHADACYNRVAAAHWHGWRGQPQPEPLLHKQLAGLHWLTNGYDSWFPRRAVSPTECAALALLDYFNTHVDGTPFRARCTTATLAADGPDFVDRFLAPFDAPLAEPVFAALELGELAPAPEQAEQPVYCCPYHDPAFDATRHEALIDEYDQARRVVRWFEDAPIAILGQELLLDTARFVVDAGKIHVLSEHVPEPLHFAACRYQADQGPLHVKTAATLTALQPVVPPILYATHGHHHHLMFDLFRNSWTIRDNEDTQPLPYLALSLDD